MNHDNRAARFAAREETLRPVATRAGRRRGARGGITTAWESLAREEIEQAALDLIRRRGPEILATARRYAQTLDDADDAYQRGLEILLRKAPTTSEVDLVRWLKVVVYRTIGGTPRRGAQLGCGRASLERVRV